MKISKGIHQDSIFKLGKTAPRIDKRTIKLSSILKALPPIPTEYNFDSGLKFKIPLQMFGNDKYGDCVIAGRANQTLRFEAFEQQRAIVVTTKDVTTEYLKESGGLDSGLVMLDSLNAWRKGWKVAGQTYDIYAFASVNPKDLNEVKASIYLLGGLYIGLSLPLNAQDQINAGKPWDVTSGPKSKPGSWGGHCVYIKQYSTLKKLIPCMTWATIQPMTFAFFQRYCDEAYAIVDDQDKFIKNSPVDVNKLNQYLREITG